VTSDPTANLQLAPQVASGGKSRRAIVLMAALTALALVALASPRWTRSHRRRRRAGMIDRLVQGNRPRDAFRRFEWHETIWGRARSQGETVDTFLLNRDSEMYPAVEALNQDLYGNEPVSEQSATAATAHIDALRRGAVSYDDGARQNPSMPGFGSLAILMGKWRRVCTCRGLAGSPDGHAMAPLCSRGVSRGNSSARSRRGRRAG
jgi:hypothetical protein